MVTPLINVSNESKPHYPPDLCIMNPCEKRFCEHTYVHHLEKSFIKR